MLRTCIRRLVVRPVFSSQIVCMRGAHKKASINVLLNEYVEGLGLKDEIVSVRPGLMRNILYPAGKAAYVSKFNGPRNRELEREMSQATSQGNTEELTSVSNEARRRAQASALESGLAGVSVLEFKRAVVPNSQSTFGSVTADDIATKLKEEYNVVVDRQMIEFKSEGGRIKSLGNHPVQVQVAGSQPITITVFVKATDEQ